MRLARLMLMNDAAERKSHEAKRIQLNRSANQHGARVVVAGWNGRAHSSFDLYKKESGKQPANGGLALLTA